MRGEHTFAPPPPRRPLRGLGFVAVQGEYGASTERCRTWTDIADGALDRTGGLHWLPHRCAHPRSAPDVETCITTKNIIFIGDSLTEAKFLRIAAKPYLTAAAANSTPPMNPDGFINPLYGRSLPFETQRSAVVRARRYTGRGKRLEFLYRSSVNLGEGAVGSFLAVDERNFPKEYSTSLINADTVVVGFGVYDWGATHCPLVGFHKRYLEFLSQTIARMRTKAQLIILAPDAVINRYAEKNSEAYFCYSEGKLYAFREAMKMAAVWTAKKHRGVRVGWLDTSFVATAAAGVTEGHKQFSRSSEVEQAVTELLLTALCDPTSFPSTSHLETLCPTERTAYDAELAALVQRFPASSIGCERNIETGTTFKPCLFETDPSTGIEGSPAVTVTPKGKGKEGGESLIDDLVGNHQHGWTQNATLPDCVQYNEIFPGAMWVVDGSGVFIKQLEISKFDTFFDDKVSSFRAYFDAVSPHSETAEMPFSKTDDIKKYANVIRFLELERLNATAPINFTATPNFFLTWRPDHCNIRRSVNVSEYAIPPSGPIPSLLFPDRERLNGCFRRRKVVMIGGEGLLRVSEIVAGRAGLTRTGVHKSSEDGISKAKRVRSEYRRHFRNESVGTELWRLKRFGLDFFWQPALHAPTRGVPSEKYFFPNRQGTYMGEMLERADMVVLQTDPSWDVGRSFCSVKMLFQRFVQHFNEVRDAVPLKKKVLFWLRHVDFERCVPENDCFLCSSSEEKMEAFRAVVKLAASCSGQRIHVVDTSDISKTKLKNLGTIMPSVIDDLEGAVLTSIACGHGLQVAKSAGLCKNGPAESLRRLTTKYTTKLSERNFACTAYAHNTSSVFPQLPYAPPAQMLPILSEKRSELSIQLTPSRPFFMCYDPVRNCSAASEISPGYLNRNHQSKHGTRWEPHGCSLQKYGAGEMERCLRRRKVMLIGDNLLRVMVQDMATPRGLHDVTHRFADAGDALILHYSDVADDDTTGIHFYFQPSVNTHKSDTTTHKKRPSEALQYQEDIRTSDLIVINIGLFDLGVQYCGLDVFYLRFKEFLESIKSRTKHGARIVIFGMKHLHRSLCDKNAWCYLCTSEQKVDVFREAQMLAAKCVGVGFVDLSMISADADDMTEDGVHGDIRYNSLEANLLLHITCRDLDGGETFLTDPPVQCDEAAAFAKFKLTPEVHVGCYADRNNRSIERCPLPQQVLQLYSNPGFRNITNATKSL